MRPGRVFLSYRREDAAFPAAWLYERLVGRFGREEVFKDVDSIDLGDDFAEVIRSAVSSCDILVAVIGPEWATITDAAGHRRLDDPNDFVRLEIETALQRDVRVVPILVGGARLPHADQLPGSLARLVRRQAMELSPNQFEYDTTRLLRAIEDIRGQGRSERGVEEQEHTEGDRMGPAEGPTSISEATKRHRSQGANSTVSIDRAAQEGSPTKPRSRQPVTSDRRGASRLWIIAAISIALAGVVLIVVISVGHGSTPSAPGHSSTPSTSSSGAAQMQSMDALLLTSSDNRQAVSSAVAALQQCNTSTVPTLRLQAQLRRDLANQSLNPPVSNLSSVPGGATLVTLWREAMSISAQGDDAYADWGQEIESIGCSGGKPPQTATYAKIQALEQQGGKQKQQFATQYNQIADGYGLRHWAPYDF